MGESAEGFYDDLAQWYHLIFEDWNRSIAYQGAVLGPILERHTGKKLPLCSGLCLWHRDADHRVSAARSHRGRF